ncbi:vacuolar membrane-associated protein iml1 [Malassezia caprae]|uniref:Vacuolar membrane-associated protein IML1 n=1 Tax=Malassezia caprae TaxID=1381934 RepID=A0AAF0EAE2_9BASI|nr:vacuolar membrane-associated protein iml1 [Malassezia caprae]
MPRHGATPPRGMARGRGASATLSHDGHNSRLLMMWTHQPPNFSRHDFVMSPAHALPQISDAELLMVLAPSAWDTLQAAVSEGTDLWPILSRALVFTPVQALADQEVIARQQQLQLSIHRHIAGLCGLMSRTQVVLARTSRARHTLTHVELYFKDQYIGRADMWRLCESMVDACVYVGQTVTLAVGIRAKIGRLFIHEHSVMSGYVAPSTLPIFRTESARCSVFVQMSREMWEFDESGEIHYEKALYGFLPDLIRKWDSIGTSHVVSIVLFTRVLYDESEREHLASLPVQRTSSGQLYVDYYKVLLELDSSIHWPSAMRRLKEEFFRFQHDILLQPRGTSSRFGLERQDPETTRGDQAVGGRMLLGRFAQAHEGNVLEAINLLLNSAEKHYIDRDLTITGFSFLLLTAGTGHFFVDKSLLRITTQRMFDLGLSLDLVCLTQMPLHTVPLFRFMSQVPATRSEPKARTDTHPLFVDNARGPSQMCEFMPFWVNGSFYNIEQDRPYWETRFVPRCRMDGLRMTELLGSLQQELSLPYLALPAAPRRGPSASVRERFDEEQFAPANNVSAPPTPTVPYMGSIVPPGVSRVQTPAPPTPRAPSFDGSVHSARSLVLEDLGKTVPTVSESITSLVAASRRGATTGDASRLLLQALGAYAPRAAPQLVEASHTSATRVAAMEDTELDASVAAMAGTSPEVPRVNALNPRVAMSERNALLFRWQNAFIERINQHTVKWWSMTLPACLPLTTRYLPSEHELAHSWHEYPYTVSVHSDTASIMLKRGTSTSPALAMLREMCAQRLAQGFQLVERPVARPGTAPGARDARQFVLRHPTEMLRPGNFADGDPVYLTAMDQVHCISYSRQAGMIRVTRYVKKVPYSTSPISYRCCMWPRWHPGYRPLSVQFHHPDPHAYNWTYLDSIIAGYEDTFIESLRYWRSRFVLVPSEGSPPPMMAGSGDYLSDEEVRLMGMDRLAELFMRAEYYPRGRPRHARDIPLRFLPTTLDPSSSLSDASFVEALAERNDELDRRHAHDPRPRQRESAALSLSAIAEEMRASKRELKIHDRVWHRVLHRRTFTGADLVTWLCRTYSDIHTRDDAVQLGNKLLRAGHMEHTLALHGFLDGHYFYRLAMPNEPSAAVAVATVPDAAATASVAHAPDAEANAHAERCMARTRVQLSRSMLIDVDPERRSSRAEVAVLHHDLAHNAENGFNFQIQWLGATARLIEDLVQSWTRSVERYGLRLVEAPIHQIKDIGLHTPFIAPLSIPLALAPPTPSAFAALVEEARRVQLTRAREPQSDLEAWLLRYVLAPPATQSDRLFEMALVRDYGFVLDQEAQSLYPSHLDVHYSSRPMDFDYTQFVHRSGVAFIQVVGGRDGYLWLNNRMFNARWHTQYKGLGHKHAVPPLNATQVRQSFQRLCADEEALRQFYDRVWQLLAALASTNNGPT